MAMFINSVGKNCKNENNEKEACGQSYKDSRIVNYDSRVVTELKIPHLRLQSPNLQSESLYKIDLCNGPLKNFESPRSKVQIESHQVRLTFASVYLSEIVSNFVRMVLSQCFMINWIEISGSAAYSIIFHEYIILLPTKRPLIKVSNIQSVLQLPRICIAVSR